jgi:N-methylhydantoinase B
MTNTLNTPVEALEAYYPFKVTRYAIRRGSGGRGARRGGDGVVREIEVLDDVELTLLAERRASGAYGLCGGEEGAPGTDCVLRGGKRSRIAAKASLRLRAGERLHIETPGGGGWGTARVRRKPTRA